MNQEKKENVEDILPRDAGPVNSIREETRGMEKMDIVEIMDIRLTKTMEENGDSEEREM